MDTKAIAQDLERAGVIQLSPLKLLDVERGCRCAVGVLLHLSGVPDRELLAFDEQHLSNRGYYEALFEAYPILRSRYLFRDASELGDFIWASDKATNTPELLQHLTSYWALSHAS